MAKRFVFYFFGFVLLASLAYYGFHRWKDSQSKVNLWTLVPEHAAFVLETNNHTALVEHLQATELWDSYAMIPVANRLEESIAWLDSISPGTERLTRFLDKKEILTSVHVVGKSELQYVFYVPVNTVGEHRFLRTLTENVARSTFFKDESREYQGFLLTDIQNTATGSSFTYFSYHNNIILSPSPVLIEEIVRRINRGKPTSIAADFKSTNYLSQPDVYANILVNYRALPELLGLFVSKDLMPQVRYLSSLCRNGMLELKLEQNKLFLNGFSNPEDLKDSFQNRLKPDVPKPLQVRKFLPNRTAVLFHFGAGQVSRLRELPRAAGTIYATTLDSLALTFRQEVALDFLESYNINAKPEKVVFAQSANPNLTLALLRKLSNQVNTARKLTSHTEKHGNYAIEQLNIPELPEQLFGKLFGGFEQSYVVQLDNYLLFADEVSTIRGVLDDIASDNVWGKSVTQKVFLEETLQEANFSLFLNTVNAWYVLSKYVADDARDALLQQASLIRRFNQVSVQFSKVEKQYYTSALFRRLDNNEQGETGFEELAVVPFTSRLASMPYPVQSVSDRSREILVLDSANMLHLVSATGDKTWSDSLGSDIRGGVRQIEIGEDKKLHYVFATASRIHALNGQGKQLENFPFNVSDSLRLQHLAVFDYEGNGNYRLLTDDNMGNLYMFDMRGNAIEGWQPRRLDYRLAAAPQHLRIGNRDVILVLLENGYVYALNRNGDPFPGFPFSLRAPITSAGFARIGGDLRKSEVTVVTRYGEMVVFNLQGQVQKREQLLRPTKSAMFELVPDNREKSYVIVRQDLGRVTFFDQDLKQLFDKQYVTSAPKQIQYFHFGGDRKIYAVTETGPQKTYLYDFRADLIGDRALSSQQPVTISFNESTERYTLFKVFRRDLKKMSFRL
ncbi:hypothetical protein FVR03_15165 [Pontibacter qinzhouensis]|uniref:DUF3352 domain-containing protein n=1 Tax=Pontibacter qinzhouensis TaxID=2603253 RepID=A0A5C8JLS2_9BACT|nr:hypothetical protein [Pontibacter qinzhouensis]TXK37577.1 hypothetical protein FVR03_15165 [Pontibacter qinzhouensis]